MDDNIVKFPELSKYPALKEYFSKEDKYILDEHRNIIPATLFEWGAFMEKKKERIVRQDTVNDLWVSTVFMGLDHNWPQPYNDDKTYRPHIFETMVFRNGHDIYCDRYSTWAEAEEGHKKAIQWIADGCKEEKEEDE